MKKALEVFEGLLAAVERGKGPTTASGKVPTTVRKADVSLFDDNFKWDEGLTKEEVSLSLRVSFFWRKDASELHYIFFFDYLIRYLNPKP